MAEVKLNDGIFHPTLNRYGWRCRWTGGDSDSGDMLLWTVNNDAFKLNTEKDCFNTGFIYTGSVPNLVSASGRPDGRMLVNETTIISHTEW